MYVINKVQQFCGNCRILTLGACLQMWMWFSQASIQHENLEIKRKNKKKREDTDKNNQNWNLHKVAINADREKSPLMNP